MSKKFYFDPSAEGTAVFLGPLQAKLMELAWEKKTLTVKKALFYLDNDKNLAYTTIMTLLNRLAEEELLKKEKEGRIFTYQPTVTKAEFLKERLKLITTCLKQFKKS
ncbi:MAG: BlaI/MecI/CopY family transcriptional regulator [FCB group bacterium]|nr:BlaI/MecI/CopY family transcriptional regulator [FCB group bacterium]